METKIKTDLRIVNKKHKTEKGVVYSRTCVYCGNIVSFLHTKKPTECPFCNQSDYVKPYTETQLFLLQTRYLETREQDLLADMYIILIDYSKSIIKKLLPNSFSYHYDAVNEKAQDVTNIIIELYLTKNAFKIEKSFAGYLDWKAKEVLWNKKTQREEDHLSLETLVHDGEGNSSELNDLIDTTDDNPFFNDYNEYEKRELIKADLVQGITKIINRILQTVQVEYTYKDTLLLLIGVWIEINNTSNLEDRNSFYELYHSNIKKFVDKSLLFIYEYIKDSQRH